MIVGNLLTPIENVLTDVLEWLHTAAGLPWAWSIVALTIMVRMLIVPLTVRQIHSMQNLQRHAPQMKEIQKKYAHDKQKRNEELMKFYRENQINPAASCLPIVPQIPIFFALYFVLRDFEKEVFRPGYVPRGENRADLDWLGLVDITDKASSGWGPLLIVIYGASQFASTYFMTPTMDKTQRTIMLALPLAFIFVIVNFPAGLVLYWVTTNLWTVGQGLITRRLVPRTAPAAPKRSSRSPRRDEPDAGDGARPDPPAPKPAPAAAAAPAVPRRVKRKKKHARR